MPFSDQDMQKFYAGKQKQVTDELQDITRLRVASSMLARMRSSTFTSPEVINVGVTFRTDGRGVPHVGHDMKAIQSINNMVGANGKKLFPFTVNPVALPRGASGGETPARTAQWNDLDDIHLLYIPGAPTANDTQEGSSIDLKKHREEAGLNKAAIVDPAKRPDEWTRRERESVEHVSRAAYELRLLGIAKERGIPVLAVCAGSWRLLESYGGKVRTLEVEDRKKHKSDTDTWGLQHALKLHGGAKMLKFAKRSGISLSEFSGLNSTHWAVASSFEITLTTPDNKTTTLSQTLLNGTGTPSRWLEVTAQDPDLHTVEAFESLFGAPVMGIQWHPESYLPGMLGENQGSEEARGLSLSLFEFMAFAAQTAKRRRDISATINLEQQAFEQICECLKLVARDNMVGAGNAYLAARSALPVELWSGRIRAIDAAIDMFDHYYRELLAKRMVAAAHYFRDIQSQVRPYGIQL